MQKSCFRTWLTTARKADGFVIVPAPCEGYGPGSDVTVYLYD